MTKDNKYILINYGSVKEKPAEKVESDILSCFNKSKLILDHNKISKIICVYTSTTNIYFEQFDQIREMMGNIEIELIGIDTISHDLAIHYPNIAYDHLGIMMDTHQFYGVDDFIKVYDANGINSPMNTKFFFKENELSRILDSIRQNKVTVVTRPSGIGKTRLVLKSVKLLMQKTGKSFALKIMDSYYMMICNIT